MQLGQQCAVLVVGLSLIHDREDRGVLQLAGPGVGDRAPVGGRRGEPDVGEVVAVAEAGQQEGGVDGGDDGGDGQQPALGVDDFGHGLRLDRVPQFDDGEPGGAAVREAHEFGDQVLAQGAARAVVDQRGLALVPYAQGVADRAADRSLRGGARQVVVEGDAAGDGAQQPLHHGPAGVGVQPADDRDGQLLTGHAAPDRRSEPSWRPDPYRRSKRSTRPAVSITRALPV